MRVNDALNLVGTLSSYETYEKSPVQTLLSAINGKSRTKYDVIIIQSDIGNGATHLLHGVFSHLVERGKSVAYSDSQLFLQRLVYHTQLGKYVISKGQMDIDYFLLDSYHYYESTLGYFQKFSSKAKYLIDSGIKIVVSSSIGCHDKLIREFPNHLVVTSEFPQSEDSLIRILENLLSSYQWLNSYVWENEEVKIKVLSIFARQPYPSVRVLQSIFIIFMINLHVKRSKLAHKELPHLVEEYLAIIRSFIETKK